MPSAPSTPAAARPWTPWVQLLRWDRPTGRLILLLPAGWSLWLADASPPAALVGLILLGGLAVSGAGCIANDLWDRRIDAAVQRTRDRPLARGAIAPGPAVALLLICLVLALLVVLALPAAGRPLCLGLALLTLPPVLLYPSAKRWCPLPQLVLALCWGFAVLIPWAALRGDLAGGWPLVGCWGATLLWTFGFDTVYAMADREDDRRLGVRSSALTLGPRVVPVVAGAYVLAWLLLLSAAWRAGMGVWFWPAALLAGLALGRESLLLARQEAAGRPLVARHFSRQVRIGALLLLALILGRVSG